MTKEKITPDLAISEYADMVYRIAMSQVKNHTDAEDIFQEVFLRLVKNIHKLQTREHLKAWLIRVTINCCKSHYTNPWNKNVGTIEETQEIGVLDENLSRCEEHPVTVEVKKLPPKYQLVIYLFYYEELSIEEIAKSTNQSKSAVKTQLSRAREQLKKKLGEQYEGI